MLLFGLELEDENDTSGKACTEMLRRFVNHVALISDGLVIMAVVCQRG
jgi:hypothetical protein